MLNATIIEYLGVITGILYLWLEIKQHPAMWIVGFFTSILYVYVFYISRFYAGMALNVYYTAVSIYGFLIWRKGAEQSGGELTYSRLSWRNTVLLGLLSAFLFAVLAFSLARFTDSPVPIGDGFVSALSVVATFMLARKWIAHWYVWIVVDAASIFIYYAQGLYPTAFLYLCYTILVVIGWINWLKTGRKV